MRERWKQFQQLPPEERQRLRREWKERRRKFQQLPPEERQRLRREWQERRHRLEQLPPEERQRLRRARKKGYLHGPGRDRHMTPQGQVHTFPRRPQSSRAR